MKPLKDMLDAIEDRSWKIYARALKFVEAHAPMSRDDARLLGVYLILVGLANWAIQRWLQHEAVIMMSQWLPAFRPPEPSYNRPFVAYIVTVLSIIGLFALKWTLQYMPRLRAGLIATISRMAVPLAAFAIVAMLASFASVAMLDRPLFLSRAAFALAALIFLPRLVSFLRAEGDAEPPRRFGRKSLTLLLFVPILLSLALAARAWYPVELPNDYIEFPDQALVSMPSENGKASLQPVSRPVILDCLSAQERTISMASTGSPVTATPGEEALANAIHEAVGIPVNVVMTVIMDAKVKADASATPNSKAADLFAPALAECPAGISYSELDRLRGPMKETGDWQSQAGRLLYHHSYIFVPAIHMLKYGILSPVPHLYGLGDTLFYTLLMKLTAPTLTAYFNTFPVSQLTGILAIALLVFYATRSPLAVPAALALLLIAFYRIGFAAIQMAPGFSPLRYAGLALQAASVFWVFRGASPGRPLGMLIALAASLFWNTEFAAFGLVSQGLALLSPQLRMPPWRRLVWLAGAVAIFVVGLMAVGFVSRGFIGQMQAEILGIAVPTMPLAYFLPFCAGMGFFAALLAWGAMRFGDGERSARLCLLPILMLLMIKCLFYASYSHLYSSLVFIAPMALAYVDWLPLKGQRSINIWSYRRKRIFLAAVLVILCLAGTVSYAGRAHSNQTIMIEPFVQNTWAGLGESFSTVTPAEPIVSRMDAVRSQVHSDDTVLFLSPLDHLMSFYGNPRHYCGHFELLTNFHTHKEVQETIDCIRAAPHALVVYDDAVETPCPPLRQLAYYDPNSCYSKKKLLFTMKAVMDVLRPELVLVKKEGPLSFYRHAADQAYE